jgi:hypothetical protein
MRAATELAYLRDAETRGIVEGAEARQKALLDRIEALRPRAVTESAGARPVPPHLPAWWPRRRQISAAVRGFAPPPAGSRPAASWAPPRP